MVTKFTYVKYNEVKGYVKKTKDISGGSILDTVDYRVDNSNFLSSLKSNTTLVLTENIILENGGYFEIRNLQNVTIICETGKAKITTSGDMVCHIINSSNILFDNIIFESTTLNAYTYGAVTAQQNADNIKFVDCDFITERTNGVSMWCVLDTGVIKDIYFERCTFNTGRMGIEFVNHLADTVKRYKNVIIKGCIFESFGTVDNPMAISLSGYGEGCSVRDNTFYSNDASAIGVELAGCCNSNFDGNKFKGSFMYFCASNNRQMNNLSITNNKMLDGFSAVGTYIYNIVNSMIHGNTFGYTRIVKSSNLNITNNSFLSSVGTALILDNSYECYLSGNYYSTYNANMNATTLFFYGINSYNNRSYNDTFIRSVNYGGVYFGESNSAHDNVVQMNVIGAFNYPYNSPANKIVKKNLTNNVASFLISLSYDSIGEKIGSMIEYYLIFADGNNNNTQSRIACGVISFNTFVDSIAKLPLVSEIISNADTTITATANDSNIILNVSLENNTVYTNCVGIFEGKGMGFKKISIS